MFTHLAGLFGEAKETVNYLKLHIKIPITRFVIYFSDSEIKWALCKRVYQNLVKSREENGSKKFYQ